MLAARFDGKGQANISCLEFDRNGSCLATGDCSGRVVLYRRRNVESKDEWFSYHYFQSHELDFDYLKSVDIAEKINKICFLPSVDQNIRILSTNDKTIKLWKIRQSSQNVRSHHLRHIYKNAHNYHIDSLSMNSDGETFLSADDLRINWWNQDRTDTCFNVLDIKPSNMEDLTEVITSAHFHPIECNLMMYSSSKGLIKLLDLRLSALCGPSSGRCYSSDYCSDTLFSEVLASISDTKFSVDGKYILSRDYLTVKIWDIAMESRPIQTILIAENLRPKLSELYESECIFDKFEADISPDGSKILTGNYANRFSLWNMEAKNVLNCAIPKECKESEVSRISSESQIGYADYQSGFDKKVLNCSWHPTDNKTVAVAAQDDLFIYNV